VQDLPAHPPKNRRPTQHCLPLDNQSSVYPHGSRSIGQGPYFASKATHPATFTVSRRFPVFPWRSGPGASGE
jgi:hypothetical protein